MVAAPAAVGLDLVVEQVSAGYGDRLVLRDVSLSVAAGEVVGVIGPNGSGKSTLIRVITRLLPARAGRVLLGGRPVERYGVAELARTVAVVPQGATLPEGFTGLEVALLGRTPHLRLLQTESRRDVAIARAALARCDALRLADQRVGEMAGGERQRLLVARALAQQPRLLLLDEPTAHLDLTHQAALCALVVERCREDGLAALFVLHDLTLAAQFCDRLVLLGEGRVLAEGAPDAVLQPERLARAYGGPVSVLMHPRTGRPVVVPI
jgi:ABC-type cobalamin/Fe3+-siderophores transport system ATPase subunit